MAGPATLLSVVLAVLAVAVLVPGARRSRRALDGGAPAAPDPSHDGPPARPVRLLHLAATAGVVVAVLLIVPGLPGGGLAVVAGAAVWSRRSRWESSAARRRRATLDAELPHVVDLMTAALAAGAAPTTALALVAEVVDPVMEEELRSWTTRLALGGDPVTVWESMAGHPQLGRLGTTLHRSAESGAPVTAALQRLSEDLRARRRAAVEERVRQVEVRAAVPLGVCLLPAFVLVGVVPLVAGSVSGLLLTR
jgi:Flp pilus assembly protein TadB